MNGAVAIGLSVLVLTSAPRWLPVEGLVSESPLIVDATLGFDGGAPQFVIHEVFKGTVPTPVEFPAKAFKWASPGRAVFFLNADSLTSYTHESVWTFDGVDAGTFHLPWGLAVPLSWPASVSPELIRAFVRDSGTPKSAVWTVSEFDCREYSVRDEWIPRAFGDGGQSVICMGRDAGAACLPEALTRGETGVSNIKSMTERFVDVSTNAFEVVFVEKQRTDPLRCGGRLVVAERCTAIAPIDGGFACVSADQRKTVCAERAVVGSPRPLRPDGLRCAPDYLPLADIDQTGARFSCSTEDRFGVPLSQIGPRGHCLKPQHGPLRCEGVSPDGGSAGQLRRAVFERR